MTLRNALLIAVLTLPLTVPVAAHETGFPEKTLKSIFPAASGFTARKKTFTPAQVKQIEQASGSKLEHDDNPLNFYVALGKPDVLGTVVMIDADGPKGNMDIALGVKKDGSIAKVLITENKDDQGLSASAFLDQLKGKTAQSPLAVGKDLKYAGNPKSAEAFLSAVRRGLQMLAAASK